MIVLLLTVFGGSAMALEQKGKPFLTPHKQQIALPSKAELTMAQAVTLLVQGYDLNIDHMRFIKEPQASDYFTKIADDAPYATDFIIAHLNGLPLDRDIDPSVKITKQVYADLLFQALSTKGDFIFIEIFMLIEDAADIDSKYMNSIQKVLISDIASLDKEQKFHPKAHVKAGEARVMLHKALLFLKKHDAIDTPQPGDKDVEMTIQAVTENVNKVVLSWGTKPHPGYGISIDSIEFKDAGIAAIYYQLHYPDPDKMYPQVIVEPKAETYIDSKLKPIMVSNSSSGMGSSSSSPAFDVESTDVMK